MKTPDLALPNDFIERPVLNCPRCGHSGNDYKIEIRGPHQSCRCIACNEFLKHLSYSKNCSSPEQAYLIEQKTKGCCVYCGKYLSAYNGERTVEHIVPRKFNGGNNLENLWLCCKSCNSSKGAKTIDQYKEYKSKKNNGKLPFTF